MRKFRRCFFFVHTHLLSSFWTSRVHRCRPFSPPVLAFNFIAHRVQQSHCSSIFHRVLLTHALALSASQFVHKKKSQRFYTSTCMHSGGFELTKLTYFYLFYFFLFTHFYFPASGQAVVTGVVPSPPRFLPSVFIAHRVQQSHYSSTFHRVLLTHALALSASQFVHKKKSQRIYTSMHSAGLGLTKLTYTRLEDNLIRHRGDRWLEDNLIRHRGDRI